MDDNATCGNCGMTEAAHQTVAGCEAWTAKHRSSCECPQCLGADYARFHAMVSRDEYAERG